jgi:hypothetical protein
VAVYFFMTVLLPLLFGGDLNAAYFVLVAGVGFALVGGAIFNLVERGFLSLRAWRWKGRAQEAAAFDALQARAGRLRGEIDGYNQALLEAVPQGPYRAGPDESLRQRQEQIAAELAAVGGMVNDLLAGT